MGSVEAHFRKCTIEYIDYPPPPQTDLHLIRSLPFFPFLLSLKKD
ncbi:hypothetical protein BGS_1420 [Beggiatoa sp. SS]|nr:hypothetical protein BGS_1420 [Beggiatoa sp. SS]